MMGTDLNNLLDLSNRIINNLNTLKNNTVTSDMSKQISQINQDLTEQQKLLSKTNTKQLGGETNKNINSNIQQQNQLISDLGLNQQNTSGAIDKSLIKLDKSNIVTDKLIKTEKRTVAYNTIQIKKANLQSKIIGDNFGTRTPESLGTAGEFMLAKNWKTIGKGIGTLLEWIPFAQYVGKAIKIGVGIAEDLVEAATEISGMVNDFADKLQDTVSKSDEAIRSTYQQLGLVSTKAFGTQTQVDQIQKNILVASSYMVQKVGIAFGPEQIAEFQKSYAEISKLSLAFHETDYVTMGEVQTVLDLSAHESAELAKMFIDMGSSVGDVSKFVTTLMDASNQSGVNSRMLIKDMKDYFKSSNLFKFGGGLQDISRIMSYAKRIKVDLSGMFKLMDSVSEPEAIVDLGAQLQALDTVFLGLDPIDLMGAAMGDVEQFMKMITDPMRDNIDKFFDIREGQMTTYGKNFSRGLLNIKGIDQVFKSQQELADFFAKSGKEKDIKTALMNSAELYSNFLTLTPEEQNDLIGVLAANIQGSGLEGKITGLNDIRLKDLKLLDFKTLLKPDFQTKSLEEAAVGTMSVKDRLESNKLLVDSMSWTTKSINDVNTALTSDEFRGTLMTVSNAIMDVGLAVFDDTNFRNLALLHDNLKLTVTEAYLFGDLLVDNAKTGINILTSSIKSAMGYISEGSDVINSVTTTSTALPEQTQSRGGLIDTKSIQIPNKSLQSSSKFMSAGGTSSMLSDLLSSFMTNRFGPGVVSQMGPAGTTKIIVTGEIRNIINEKDVGAISGDKILKILENHMKKTLGKQPITNPEKYLQNK